MFGIPWTIFVWMHMLYVLYIVFWGLKYLHVFYNKQSKQQNSNSYLKKYTMQYRYSKYSNKILLEQYTKTNITPIKLTQFILLSLRIFTIISPEMKMSYMAKLNFNHELIHLKIPFFVKHCIKLDLNYKFVYSFSED